MKPKNEAIINEKVNKLYKKISLVENDEELNNFIKVLVSVFYYSIDGIYIVDKDGFTQRINPAFESITGISEDDVINRNVSELVEQGYFSPSVALEVLKTKKAITLVQENKNGKITLVTGNPVFDDDGNIIRVISNIRDITELTNLYEELSRKKTLLNTYSQILNNKNQLEIEGIIATSEGMRKTINLASKVAAVGSTVLLLGESGVGKGIIAKLIHTMSEQSNNSFIVVNCSAIPEQLLESELFGYGPGAFTGANKNGKVGLIEAANNGILFLDEIGELPLTLQPKILNFLESGEITRIGSTTSTKVNVRIITATNRDLAELVEEGIFRADLYYRLNVLPISIPPLRERKEDITPLILKYVKDFNKREKSQKTISKDVINILMNYSWPGNVRQLKNAMERTFVMSASNEIVPSDLPSEILDYHESEWRNISEKNANLPVDMPQMIKDLEDSLIKEALIKGGSIRNAAKLLGVNPSTVFRRIKK